MKFVSISSLCLIGISVSSAYEIYKATAVNCRSGPGTNYEVIKTYTTEDDVSLKCQASGEDIKGNTLWDKTTDGCYISDYYLHTGSNGYVAKKCKCPVPPPSNDDNQDDSSQDNDNDSSSDSKVPGPITDDYPYKNDCDGVDKWNYYKCQCTSFAAWRINERLGVKFHNYYKGPNWGDANTWDDAAKATSVPINSKPVPGCIAQTDAGKYGHVAWVTKVSGSSVTIEEYNWATKEGYGTRTVPKNTFKYIHIKA
ncbi:hypothetical protein LPJ78_002184 [Coemansia sp. RSA 989]|nr:hypothetical protein BX667DRAFT_512891 [Coemansia mojavensis]KAJ1742918.1 hypothetical protein LPJ68_001513 [Coemansia sp. RSA 1086]KAJ1749284.1 hypothetical protein LPJ79_003827 [Coemansia sp. RSA 1821]KAJ1866088.1 hypothetical protein LPJ78_002184 [Coemansia sp. RSA 989]KAJ1873252.1 hypothetical protein LPJ55_002405 [Coemansia sp. RSA 990]KAJ2630538.1 hypothetical protein H4R22_002595 [Coemansia sp. RSA 1290]KAJ2648134.1 hypothetical protein IWW40_004112 [Coemansia sp. RSA 1250]KAJ26699